jgi:O-antigen/teichoic acid export membrane protein
MSLLYRSLLPVEAGQMALLLSLVDIFALLTGFGMPTVITRKYSSQPAGTRDWPADLAGTVAFSSPWIAGAFVLSLVLYDVPPAGRLYLPLAIALSGLLQASSMILASQGRYSWPAVLLRLPNAMLLAVWLIGLAAPSLARLAGVLLLHGLSILMALTVGLILLWRSLPRGRTRLTLRERFEGLPFLATGATVVLPDQGLVAIAGRMLPAADLATYAAVAVLLRPFRLLRSVLVSILMPEFIRRPRESYSRHFAGVWFLGITAGLASVALLPPLARWLYGGRYSAGLPLIPLLTIGGILHLTAVVPKSDLSGRASPALATRYAFSLLALVVVALVIGGFLISRAALIGLALAVVLAELTENAYSLLSWRRFRRRESQPGSLPTSISR